MKHKPRHHLSFATLRLEGGLFLPDQLEKAALGAAQFPVFTGPSASFTPASSLSLQPASEYSV